MRERQVLRTENVDTELRNGSEAATPGGMKQTHVRGQRVHRDHRGPGMGMTEPGESSRSCPQREEPKSRKRIEEEEDT